MAEVRGSPDTEPQDVAGGPPPMMTAQDLIYALNARRLVPRSCCKIGSTRSTGLWASPTARPSRAHARCR